MAALLAGVAVGVALRAHASIPCPSFTWMRLKATSITVDGVARPLPPDYISLYVEADYRGGPDVFAAVWDPDKKKAIELLELRRLP